MNRPNPMSRLRRRAGGRILLWIMLVLLAMAGMGVAWGTTRLGSGNASAAEDARGAAPVWYDVQRRSFDLTVVASGELEAKRKVELKSQVQGTNAIVEIIEEGKAVHPGDVLLRLADDQIREKIEQERLSVEQARAERMTAEQNLAIEESDAEMAMRSARLKLELAQLELDKWRSGTDVQERRDQKLALEKANRNLVRAERDEELSRQLFEEKFISQNDKDDAELKALEAKSELISAQQRIDIYEKYTRPKEEKKFSSDVDQAKAELDKTIQKNSSNLARARVNLQSKVSMLKIREDRLDTLEEELANTVIRAPQDGLVVYATSSGRSSRYGSSEPLQQGRQVRYNESLIILPDTRQMVAVLKVHESMLPLVKLDQNVSITIDARPGRPIEGRVTQIAVMAENSNWLNPELREYVVRVDLPSEENSTLKPAMRCSGRILLGTVEDSLAVPLQAVVTEGRQRFCYVPVRDGRVQRRPVTIGRASETYVEIVEGLDPGDRVLLRKPRPGEVLEQKTTPVEAAPQTAEAAKPEAGA